MGHLFSKIFGGRQHPHQKKITTSHDQVVLDIKITRDKVSRYQKQLQTLMQRETEIAKQLLKEGKRDRAKLALSKRKYQEQLLQKTDQQLSNLQQLCQEIEFAQIEAQVVQGLKTGKDALVSLQKEMGSIEDIEKLMDESKEAIEYQQQISQLLSEQLSPEDNQGIELEFEQLEKEILTKKLDQVVVPDEILVKEEKNMSNKEEKEEEEEIEEKVTEQPIAA
jgi:charged multivesicular body protein 6